MPRKRSRTEMEASEPPQQQKEPSLLQKIRNMWEFANVMQFIFIFGKAMKIDEDFDIEDFETECLQPGYSEKLEEIGLALLKWISSHRGLNYDIWDEYTRRQYVAKAPNSNPYGEEEEPKKFRDFDIFQKIRILHQLTVWTFWNPDRLRERMPEHQREIDQLDWRVEEFGYDKDDRNYYLLDDNRLYRRTEPPLPPVPKAKPKSNTLKAQAARRRASKRRRIADSTTPELEDGDESQVETSEVHGMEPSTPNGTAVDTLGGYKWECVAISLTDYQDMCESLKKTRDPNEKALRERLVEEVLPVIEAAAEKQRRKIERRERELLALEKMAHAKRSSRIADKHDRERREHEALESERKRTADLAAALRERERQEQMEMDRQSRMMTREQRIKDREYKRILKEEELARDAEEARRIEEGRARGSERQIKERIEKTKKELETLNAEEEWTFDCSGCGVHGKNLDDGSHSVACDKCNVWQHSKCLGVSKAAAEKDDFTFVCRDCKRKEEDAKRPKISLKFRVGSSSSPAPPSPARPAHLASSPPATKFAGVEIPRHSPGRPSSQSSMTNGYRPNTSASPPQMYGAPQYYPQLQPNGYQSYGYVQQPHVPPPFAYPTSQQPSSYRPGLVASASPPTGLNMAGSSPNRPVPHPGSSGPHWQANPYHPTPYNGQQNTSPQYNPYYNAMSHQSQAHPAVARLPQALPQQTPHPSSVQAQTNGQTLSSARLPSPVVNRPIMSPSQGNYDVGPVAGIQQKSSPVAPSQILSTPSSNGTINSQHRSSQEMSFAQTTPTVPRPNYSPTPQHLSGISPTKNRSNSPLPPPSTVPMKMSMSPHPPSLDAIPAEQKRTVSGTPIFPPAEKLAPSPEQLRKSPVPTPSKQAQPHLTPARVGEAELRRVSGHVEQVINGAPGRGYGDGRADAREG